MAYLALLQQGQVVASELLLASQSCTDLFKIEKEQLNQFVGMVTQPHKNLLKQRTGTYTVFYTLPPPPPIRKYTCTPVPTGCM